MADEDDSAEAQIDEQDIEAEYALEHEVLCPYCNASLGGLQVVRLLRAKINFTSTLPRRGRVLICPVCKKIVSAELAGFA